MSRRFKTVADAIKFIRDKGSDILAIVDDEGNEFPVDRIPLTKEKVKWFCSICEVHKIGKFEAILDKKRTTLTCSSCGISKSRGGTGYAGFVKQLEARGWKMDDKKSSYTNNKSRMKVICDQGHSTFSTQNRFQSKHGCKECDNERRRVHNISEVADEFAAKGFKLLATKYISNSTLMPYICKCGVQGNISYSNFLDNQGHCKKCKPSPFADKEIRRKIEEDNLVKYGRKHYMTSDAGKQRNMEEWGHEVYVQSEIGKQRMVDKWGVTNAMHSPELFAKQQKASFSLKPYTFPSGRTVHVQGYEHFALRDLISEGIDEDNILVSSDGIPCIEYTFEGKTHMYHPDIYISSLGKFVEVKSEYTFESSRARNVAKFQAACISYNFELRIYTKKGELTDKREFVDSEIHFVERE